MRIIFLPGGWTFLLCCVVWLVLQVGFALICLFTPNRYFSQKAFVFRSHRWEKEGYIYERVFKVRSWKHLLPDGGNVYKKRGFKKKRLKSFDQNNLEMFLIESARGEMTHWLPILFFWIFWLFTPPIVPWIMLVYAVVVNAPCIIAQRYNRPRVQRLLTQLKSKDS